MRKLYGDALRKDGGTIKTVKNNEKLFPSKGRVVRVASEVQGTFEKVFEETTDAVEVFLERC